MSTALKIEEKVEADGRTAYVVGFLKTYDLADALSMLDPETTEVVNPLTLVAMNIPIIERRAVPRVYAPNGRGLLERFEWESV